MWRGPSAGYELTYTCVTHLTGNLLLEYERTQSFRERPGMHVCFVRGMPRVGLMGTLHSS